MALYLPDIIADGFLELIRTTPVEKISVRQILEKTFVSRQSFYNHFKDKDDLIWYIYDTRVVGNYTNEEFTMNFYQTLTLSFEKMKQYKTFMMQACRLDGPNCLKDHIYKHCEEFDLKYYQYLYGSNTMPDTLRLATIYHAHASTSMSLSWILGGMTVPCEELAAVICSMRSIGIEELLKDGEHPGNPYAIDK